MDTQKLTIQQFGATIKQKYPAYSSYSDEDIGQKMLQKYPQYQDKVITSQTSQPAQSGPVNKNLDQPLASFLQPKEQKPGFLQSIAQGIASPVLKLGNTLGQLGNQVGGLVSPTSEFQAQRNAAIGSDYGYLGRQTPIQTPGEAIGTGLQIGSYLVPGGASLKGALASGAAASGLFGAGETLAKGGSAGDALKSGAEGALLGGATAGLLHTIPAAINLAKTGINNTAKFATSQATGLSQDTVNTLIHSPEKITAAQAEGLNRSSLATKVQEGIQTRLDQLGTTGKEYQAIRALPKEVSVPPTMIETILGKYGLKVDPVLDKAGNVTDINIIKNAESVPLGKGDINDIKDFLLQYGKETKLSANGFLNTRQALDKLSSFGVGLDKTDVSNKISKDLRTAYDSLAHDQLPELKQLDARYAPERKLLQKVQKDYLNGDGSLKDGAINKIANLNGKGKDQVIARLQKIVPGISEDVNMIRSLEDIELAKGFKVGAYLKSAAVAGVASGGNPVAALSGALLSNPSISVPIIKAFGKARGVSAPLIERIISKMKQGKPLYDAEKRLISAALGHVASGQTMDNQDTPDPAPKGSSGTDEYLKTLGL